MIPKGYPCQQAYLLGSLPTRSTVHNDSKLINTGITWLPRDTVEAVVVRLSINDGRKPEEYEDEHTCYNNNI